MLGGFSDKWDKVAYIFLWNRKADRDVEPGYDQRARVVPIDAI
jgi:hypothetical protein